MVNLNIEINDVSKLLYYHHARDPNNKERLEKRIK